MRRGEIWTAAGGGDYTGKLRPVVIIQDDAFAELESVTVCPFTSDPLDVPLFRVPVDPTDENGLLGPSRVMADKVTTVAKSRLRQRVGILSDQEMRRINQALIVFIGLAR